MNMEANKMLVMERGLVENMLALRSTQEHGGTCRGFCKQLVHACEQAGMSGFHCTENRRDHEASEGAGA